MRTPSAPSITKPMTELQNRWFNTLTQSLGLSATTFQLIQPSPPIVPTDAGLWAWADVIPPYSLTFNTGLNDTVGFFADYAAVAGQLQFPVSQLQQDIGEQTYSEWLQYLGSQHPQPPLTDQPGLFLRWAAINAPDVANIGASDLAQMALIGQAQQALIPYQGANAQPPDFSCTYSQLVTALANASSASWTFDSRTASPDVSNTWTAGADTGISGLYGGADPRLALCRQFARSHVTVSAACQHFTVVTMAPGGWYNSSILHTAFVEQGTPPWLADASPDWQDTFGPEGSMPRFITSLGVADGVTLTVHSDATYSAAAQRLIEANVIAGLWPLFCPSGGPVSNTVTFGQKGGMTLQLRTQPGNPLCLGANVLAAGPYLGEGGMGVSAPPGRAGC